MPFSKVLRRFREFSRSSNQRANLSHFLRKESDDPNNQHNVCSAERPVVVGQQDNTVQDQEQDVKDLNWEEEITQFYTVN